MTTTVFQDLDRDNLIDNCIPEDGGEVYGEQDKDHHVVQQAQDTKGGLT